MDLDYCQGAGVNGETDFTDGIKFSIVVSTDIFYNEFSKRSTTMVKNCYVSGCRNTDCS